MSQSVYLPVLNRLEVDNYALYHSGASDPTFVWHFLPGPNALLGVNGLGKSTLVNILFRLLVGPYDLNRRALEGDLGQPDIEPVLISDRRLFARRVADQAKSASATIKASIGKHHVSISRRLSDLSLTSLLIDGETQPAGDDDLAFYQPMICSMMGVGTFFDVLLILRFLVFVFEDRRSLIWDESAQSQLFRATMAEPEQGRRSLELQRAILEADSAARNIRVQVNKAKRQLDDAILNAQRRDASLAELHVTEQMVDAVRERQASSLARLEELEAERLQERRSRMRAEHERDHILLEIDGTKLRLLSHNFRSIEPIVQLALVRTAETGHCLCCHQHAPELVERINGFLHSDACPYCGRQLENDRSDGAEDLDRHRLDKLQGDLRLARSQADASSARIFELDTEIRDRRLALQDAERELNKVLTRQSALRRAVAIEPDEIMRRRVAVDALSDHMSEQLSRRKEAEEGYRALAEAEERNVRERQDTLAASFARFASSFMRERCHLTYIGRDDRIGQEGERFRFPSFQVALSGGTVAGETLRDSPDAVSLSQREFIDIAFRMALIDLVAPDAGGTLVVDTPEAGLDFLFAERAGRQFLEFTSHNPKHNVVVTSNLISDHLLNALLSHTYAPDERRARLLNLVDFAAPTAAVRLDADRYREFIGRIVNG